MGWPVLGVNLEIRTISDTRADHGIGSDRKLKRGTGLPLDASSQLFERCRPDSHNLDGGGVANNHHPPVFRMVPFLPLSGHTTVAADVGVNKSQASRPRQHNCAGNVSELSPTNKLMPSQVAHLFMHCQSVSPGTWFGQRRKRIAARIAMMAMTPGVRSR